MTKAEELLGAFESALEEHINFDAGRSMIVDDPGDEEFSAKLHGVELEARSALLAYIRELQDAVSALVEYGGDFSATRAPAHNSSGVDCAACERESHLTRLVTLAVDIRAEREGHANNGD